MPTDLTHPIYSGDFEWLVVFPNRPTLTVEAPTKKEAREVALYFEGLQRFPKGTTIHKFDAV